MDINYNFPKQSTKSRLTHRHYKKKKNRGKKLDLLYESIFIIFEFY